MISLRHLVVCTGLVAGACGVESSPSREVSAGFAGAAIDAAAVPAAPAAGESRIADGAASVADPVQVRPEYDIALDCYGQDNKLDFPLIASYRVNSREQIWWICFDGGGCTEPRLAKFISSGMIIFEKDEDTATVWSRESGYLTSADLEIDMQRSLTCTRTRAPPGKMFG